jgi:hypothetical protein
LEFCFHYVSGCGKRSSQQRKERSNRQSHACDCVHCGLLINGISNRGATRVAMAHLLQRLRSGLLEKNT